MKSFIHHLLPSAAIALVAFAAVVSAIDPAGSYPRSFAGPGLTIDEVFNVEQGVYLADGFRGYGWGALHPDSLQEIFGHPVYLPDHPPLGRLMLGVTHECVRGLFPPHDQGQPSRFTTAAARPASALAFSLVVLLVGAMTSIWYGRCAGTTAALALVMMPRLFGHAHLAALESCLNLTYVMAVLLTIHFWTRQQKAGDSALETPHWRTAAWTGACWGLALLTKIQAVLIPIPLVIWCLWKWRLKGIKPLAIWGVTGFIVFFVGWPWLWLDSWNHLTTYFGQATDRASLNVWYLGERWSDKTVPWHYPFVIFATTIPCLFLLLAGWGCRHSANTTTERSRTLLVIGSAIWPLIVFALPGVAVYDGERLFLCCFPLWGVVIGRGGGLVWTWLRLRMSPTTSATIFALALATQSYGLFSSHPGFLGYYNLIVGGPRGAQALGMEASFWGEGMTREFFQSVADRVPQGAEVHIGPIMHGLQIPDWEHQVVAFKNRQIKLRPWDPERTTPKYLILYSRKADLPAEWRTTPPANARLLIAQQQQGVTLAALYEFDSE
ncbi:MAG: ArnT family glycosyltransferase [Planctomycetaceae bacterium]